MTLDRTGAGAQADFPEPVVALRVGRLWSWPDVEEWARATGRLPNRWKRSGARRRP